MENQRVPDRADDAEEEEFPDEFQCCVCLDIMYKPVVLACGHISCFWCTFKTMDLIIESHCPVCRNSYNHFPKSCGLLHFLLIKLYPTAYKRRAAQVAGDLGDFANIWPYQDEEKERGYGSQQVEGNLMESQVSEVDVVQDAANDGDHLSIQDSSQSTLSEHNTSIQPTSSSQATTNEANSTVGSTRNVHVTDVQCAVCKQLLYRPVVLNCGHVYCESCIHPDDSVYRCTVCQSAHPKGIPSVCLFLHHFLEESLPKEYLARKESLAHCQSQSPTGSSTEKQEQTAKASSGPSVHRADFHPGVGCDYCGMSPIIGQRYKCKDCVEKIGFDLCENCHKLSSNQTGRFNQQHTKEHQFEVIPVSHLRMVLSSFGAELMAEDDETGFSSDDDGIA